MHYVDDFLPEAAATRLQRWLQALPDWQQESFSIYGRQQTAPRLCCWFGDEGLNYRYTHQDHQAWGWPACLAAVRDAAFVRSSKLEGDIAPFNFLLANRYDHGGHHMGWHKDDERGTLPWIASLSLGGTRRFRIQLTTGEKRNFALEHGSLLVFDGRLKHTLTKTRLEVAPRYNLTFRSLTGHHDV